MNKWEKMNDTILNRQWQEEKLSVANKKELIDYLQIRETIDGSKISTLVIDARAVHELARYLKNNPFQKATQNDMMKFDKELRARVKESTACLYETRIRRFYKYLFNKNEYKKGKQFQKRLQYPDCISWFNITPSNGSELPIEEILTDQDIKKLLNACKDTREQVIICSLLDGGITESELAKMKVRNVGFDPKLGAYFILPKRTSFKTKHRHRKVQLFLIPSSTQYIREYLNHHRYKDDPEAQFIYSLAHQVKNPAHTQIIEITIYQIVRRIAETSGVKKKITPHILRHNSATRCAKKGFNEFMLRIRFGWSKSSQMPSVYVHLAGSDIDSKIKNILGIEEEKTIEEPLLQPILCPNCEYENPSTHVFCSKCSTKLNIKKEDLGMDATETGIGVQKLIDDPQMLRQMIDMLSDRLEKKLQNGK